MKTNRTQLRRAAALLLAAAALSSTPLAAQDAQPPADPPVADVAPPPVIVPVEAPAPAPVVVTPAPAATTAPPTATQPAPQAQAPRRAAPARAASRPAPRASAPVRQAAPAATAPATAPAPAAEAPAAAAPAAAAPAPVALPPAPAAAPAEPQQQGLSPNLLWLVGGALLLGALALLFLRRRRRSDETVRDEAYEPVIPRESAAVPVVAAPLADEPVRDEPVAAAAETGRPWLDLDMRPRRAGVTGDDAVVEFELSVANQGSAPARDVRISTWLFAAGGNQESEMERALIERRDDNTHPEGTIEAGRDKRIETAMALPTAGLEGDSVLPVVVAEARYTLPDGSEGRTAARFAVGVPDGEELAHFAIDNPSGFHDDVEARPMGDVERA